MGADYFELIRQDDKKTKITLPGIVQRCRVVNRIKWQENQTKAGLKPRSFLGFEARKIELRLELLGETVDELRVSLKTLYEIYHERNTQTMKPWVYEPRFPDLVDLQIRRIVFEHLEPVYVAGEPDSRQITVQFLEEDSEAAIAEAMKESNQEALPQEGESGQAGDSQVPRDSKLKGKSLPSAAAIAFGSANDAVSNLNNDNIELEDPEPDYDSIH